MMVKVDNYKEFCIDIEIRNDTEQEDSVSNNFVKFKRHGSHHKHRQRTVRKGITMSCG